MRRLISTLSILLITFLLIVSAPVGAQDSSQKIRDRFTVVRSDETLSAVYNPLVHEVKTIEMADGNLMLYVKLKKRDF